MSLLQNSNAIQTAGGYDINNSLRFRSSASARLSRTPSTASNRRTWTWSAWVKLGALPSNIGLLTAWSADSSNNYNSLIFLNNQLNFRDWNATSFNVASTAVYRDPSAWYHIVLSVDTTQATAANRVRMYVNGSQITAFSTANYPAQNYNTTINNNILHAIGTNYFTGASQFPFDGYLADVNFIDGQALTPTSFGETDTDTGVWKPKAYTGTYGTNGFYLPFRVNSSSGFSSFYGSFNGTTQSLSATLPSTLSGQFTIEAFIRPNVVTFNPLFTLGDSSTSTGLEFYFGGGTTPSIYSDSLFQISDSYNIPATVWAHIAVTRDASNVIRLFINGTQVGGTWTSTAAFSNTVRIGAEFFSGSITGRMNGFISNFRIVTGSALYTSTFTPPSSALTAVSGTQLLTLQNSTIIDNSTNALTVTNIGSVATTSATVANTISDVGYEYSGNRNTWTTTNINYTTSGDTYDVMTDSPTLTSATVANYCTLNPLDNNGITITNANLNATSTTGGDQACRSTIWLTTGKWYWEVTRVAESITTDGNTVGVANASQLLTAGNVFNTSTNIWGMSLATGNKHGNAASVAYGSTIAVGSVVGIAYDADAQKIWFRNASGYFASGDPVAGTNAAFTNTTGTTGVSPYVYKGATGSTINYSHNFGQRAFSYTPPTGYIRLNTFNLPTSTIVKGNSFMDATLYTGTGASRSVTNDAAFRPDFVWVKGRSGATDHALYDAVRGATNDLVSNNDAAATTQAQGLTAFNSNGFTVGTLAKMNTNAATYVAWQWQAGASTVTNTSGSISSQVRANTTTGFSIVTFTGTGANATVGHGLGVAPRMIIVKNRGSISNWNVYHASVGNTGALRLNLTDATFTDPGFWNNTSPTSTVFTAGAGVSFTSSLAYCWAEIAGFSRFSSYTGNGSANGPFIYTGFRPKFVMVKNSTTAGTNWQTFDSTRDTYNVMSRRLQANTTSVEETTLSPFDFLSNGFKLRDTNSAWNANGATIIFAAFAENPFKNSLAR